MSTLHARLLPILTVLAMAVPLAAVPAAAQAKTLVRTDGHDLATIDPTDETGQRMVAADEVVGDILGVRYRHTNTRVQVRIRFADLLRVRGTTINLHMETNEARTRDLHLSSVADVRDPAHKLMLQTAFWRRGGGVFRFSCPLYRTWNYRDNLVTIGFSRTCISRPRWVRMSVLVLTAATDWTLGAEYADDAHKGVLQHQTERWAPAPRLSPRIYRG
jgi:hypothetical protein